MRAFIAIALDGDTRAQLSDAQKRLSGAHAYIKWARPENIHLTLKFLGNINDEKAEEIGPRLLRIAGPCKPFQMYIAGIGAFPGISHPRVIWAGVGRGCDKICSLRNKIEDSMEGLGIEKEKRPFSPHLTLGRVRSLKDTERLIKLIEKEGNLVLKNGVSVKNIILFQSNLTPKGPIHTPLREFPFS